jgi:hypothetical protein
MFDASYRTILKHNVSQQRNGTRRHHHIVDANQRQCITDFKWLRVLQT